MSSSPTSSAPRSASIRQSLVPSTSRSGVALRVDGSSGPSASSEDRLGLHPSRAEQLEPVVADPRMRPLVRQDASGRVRLRSDRDDHSAPLARDSVRTDVLLDGQPHRGSSSSLEDPAASHSR